MKFYKIFFTALVLAALAATGLGYYYTITSTMHIVGKIFIGILLAFEACYCTCVLIRVLKAKEDHR